jgi:hypothetical protein
MAQFLEDDMTAHLRWTAMVSYRSERGPIEVHHHFEELSELDALIERGPDWNTIIPGLLVLLSQPHDRIVVKDSVCVFQLLLSLYLRCRAMSTSSGIPGRSVLQSWLDPAKASGDVCNAKSPLRARP